MQKFYKVKIKNQENDLFFNKSSFKFQPKGTLFKTLSGAREWSHSAAQCAKPIIQELDRYTVPLENYESLEDFVEIVEYELVETGNYISINP